MNKKMDIRMDDIDHKLDELQKNMEEIWNLLDEMRSDLRKDRQKSVKKKHTKQKNKIIVVDNRSRWKKEIYKQTKILINVESPFKKRADVLHYIYNYMRKNYGIVWEQDIKEYKEHYGLEYKPKTIDVIYSNKMYKSIFESVLLDMIANISSNTNHGLEM